MISIGALYHMIPKVFGREQMHSIGLINAHFWLMAYNTWRTVRGAAPATATATAQMA